MKLTKTLTLLCAMAVASCSDYDWDLPGKGILNQNPVDDLKLMVAGLSVDTPEARSLLTQLTKSTTVYANDVAFRNVDHGFGNVILRSLRSGGFDQETNLDAVLATPSEPRCKQAKEDKVRYHRNEANGKIPLTFGKITDMDMQVISSKPEQWVGFIELCSWIKNGETYDEYFFHIDLTYDGATNTTRTHDHSGDPDDPFPGTLALSNLQDTTETLATMNMWDHKIHGKRNAVNIANVWRNGVFVDPGAEPNIYKSDQNCLDMFVDMSQLAELRAEGELDFANQGGYCMGRCDGLFMNTK